MHEEVEPWLTGTHTDRHPVLRAVVHALELADRDVRRWAFSLTEDQLGARPYGLPSVAFQVRHVARSMDRLLTYAEGHALNESQLSALAEEAEVAVDASVLRAEFDHAMKRATERVCCFTPEEFQEHRGVGRAGMPSTVAGLLIHIAEHTQRHVGQAITTAKLVAALHDTEQS